MSFYRPKRRWLDSSRLPPIDLPSKELLGVWAVGFSLIVLITLSMAYPSKDSSVLRLEEMKILNFDAEIRVTGDGLRVTERMVIDSGSNTKIYPIRRFLPSEGNKNGLRLTYRDVSVYREIDGTRIPLDAQAMSHGRDAVIWAGKSGEEVSAGKHAFVFIYTASFANDKLRENGSSRLLWNATGTRWPVPIVSFNARIILGTNPHPALIRHSAEIIPDRRAGRGGQRSRSGLEARADGSADELLLGISPSIFFTSLKEIPGHHGVLLDVSWPVGRSKTSE